MTPEQPNDSGRDAAGREAGPGGDARERGATGRKPRDPLGKGALFWLTDVDESGGGRVAGASEPAGPVARTPRGVGRRALFSGSPGPGTGHPSGQPADEETRLADDPLLERGRIAVECPECRVKSRIGVLDFVLFQLPIGFWVPRGRFSHRMTCPACRRRVWASVSVRG